MRAMAIDRFGTADELHEIELPTPEPGTGEVRLRLLAAGVNPIDYKMRDGSSGAVKGLTEADFPLILGREGCGVVEAVGEGVTDLTVGDRVFGMGPAAQRRGFYAEQTVTPAQALAAAPAGVDDATLAGTSLAGLTAWAAVHDLAKVTGDDTVLVHGAGGGVGQIVVQLALETGATVYASASGRHRERLEQLGATVVDYTTQDFRQVVPRPSVIVDGVYFGTYEPSLEHLAEGGRFVALPSLADLSIGRARGIDVMVPAISPDRERLTALAERLVDGRLGVSVGGRYPLAEVAQAHRVLEDGHAPGKLVLEIGCS